MTHQYTKLADELDAVNDVCGSRSIREAARILRSAAGVDVDGLMDAADRYALAQADPAHWRSALESDLRLALAAREDYVLQLLVAAGHVTQEKVDQARSIAAAAPKGTYPQEDRSREPPCHACGLGYKCRSANCPNTTPDPMTGPHRKEHHDQP
jgi:hypothetical protein